jgi:hypothetical protein
VQHVDAVRRRAAASTPPLVEAPPQRDAATQCSREIAAIECGFTAAPATGKAKMPAVAASDRRSIGAAQRRCGGASVPRCGVPGVWMVELVSDIRAPVGPSPLSPPAPSDRRRIRRRRWRDTSAPLLPSRIAGARAARAAKAGTGTLAALLALYGDKRGRTLKSWGEARKRIDLVFKPLLNRPTATLKAADFQIIADSYPAVMSAAFTVRSLRPALKWAAQRGYLADDLARTPAGCRKAPEANFKPRRTGSNIASAPSHGARLWSRAAVHAADARTAAGGRVCALEEH